MKQQRNVLAADGAMAAGPRSAARCIRSAANSTPRRLNVSSMAQGGPGKKPFPSPKQRGTNMPVWLDILLWALGLLIQWLIKRITLGQTLTSAERLSLQPVANRMASALEKLQVLGITGDPSGDTEDPGLDLRW